MSEVWTLITVGNLIEKLKKIKADIAAGPNQENQEERGTAFAKLCNLFMLHQIYPAQ